MSKVIQIKLGGKLAAGKFAIVDEADYHLVKGHNWSILGRGYAACRDNGATTLMHRMIMNATPGSVIDHKNNNGLDNRRDNLRVCTQGENLVNAVKRNGTSSKYKGVCFRSRAKVKAWRCNVGRIELGSFCTEEQAARAYDQKIKELYGEFAILNFP